MFDIREVIKICLKKYWLESILLCLSIGTTLCSGFLFYQSTRQDAIATVTLSESPSLKHEDVYIEIAGAVHHPNVYKLRTETRLAEAIDKAGGLSENADKLYISRTLNLASLVFDGEKIYIPTSAEVASGVTVSIIDSGPTSSPQSGVSINSASAEMLESLPSIGKVTAERIIQSRPYKALDELYTRGILSKSIYDKISTSLEL